MKYKLKSGWGLPDISPWMDSIQSLCYAVQQIQEGSNSRDGNYNANGIWNLVKIEGSTWDKWNLYYEGQPVFSIQEGTGDEDFIVSYFDPTLINEWQNAFCNNA